MAAAFSAYPQFGRFVLRFPHIFGAAAGIRTICLPCPTDRWPEPAKRGYFPAALRNAALMRSCQPGPSAWKKSRTSRSRRNEAISLVSGSGGGAGSPGSPYILSGLPFAFPTKFSPYPLRLAFSPCQRPRTAQTCARKLGFDDRPDFIGKL